MSLIEFKLFAFSLLWEDQGQKRPRKEVDLNRSIPVCELRVFSPEFIEVFNQFLE